VAAALAVAAIELSAQGPSKPIDVKGMQVVVSGVERASSAGLTDCPPGANTVRGMARGEEEFVIVKIDVKVLPSFKPGPIKRATIQDAAGKTYNTAVSFVDVASKPEFSCGIPFRVPLNTKLKSFQIETANFDLTTVPETRAATQ
jgi:hypothetical protein